MSRSNPNKRKHREARKTAQIVVEGYTEEAFCKYLKSVFARDCGIYVEIYNCRGGSPQDVVLSAMKRRGFDRTFLVYDTDVTLPAQWAATIRIEGFIKVASSPCIEALFLEILGERVPQDAAGCKREFLKYMSDVQKYDYRSYGTHFSREVLENCNHPAIKQLLSIFHP